jgi:hypothetical protein
MDVDMLPEDDDVFWPDLMDQPLVDRGKELRVEVLREILLFQPRVHSREGGWHRSAPGDQTLSKGESLGKPFERAPDAREGRHPPTLPGVIRVL